MEDKPIYIPCRTSAGVFRSFAIFETFLRQGRWRNPALFAVIFTAFALLCLIPGRSIPQSGLIGGTLLFVGLGLPLSYLANFIITVNKQAKGLHLDGKRVVYTVRLDATGMSVDNDREKLSFPWGDMAFAYRLGRCIILYPAPDQAYILPDEDRSEDLERAWARITAALPPEKVFDRRR